MFQSQTRSRPGCHLSARSSFSFLMCGFNLKREATPVATESLPVTMRRPSWFQSQTRSRPGCHCCSMRRVAPILKVSISNEKPPRLPHDDVAHSQDANEVSISNEKPPRLPPINPLISKFQILEFQSQTRSRPGCHSTRLRKNRQE